MKVDLPDARRLDLGYFVEWRQWLWEPSVAHALAYLGDLRGKRVLEIGGRTGRMSCLFALLGAEVTLIEMTDVKDEVRAEAERWGVADRVHVVLTEGSLGELKDDSFDVIFTKSVLFSVLQLDHFLGRVDRLLAPAGRVVFLENYKGGSLFQWLRRSIIHRGQGYRYFNVSPGQIPIFTAHFDQLQVRRPMFFVYEIFGRKRATHASQVVP